MRNRHQLALPIGKVEVPEHLLRAAYERSRLQIGFDQAMALTHFRICFKRLALARLKRKKV
jgi:hypothetical protein